MNQYFDLKLRAGLIFVRDFERPLGDEFFSRIKSFTPMPTETDDIAGALQGYLGQAGMMYATLHISPYFVRVYAS